MERPHCQNISDENISSISLTNKELKSYIAIYARAYRNRPVIPTRPCSTERIIDQSFSACSSHSSVKGYHAACSATVHIITKTGAVGWIHEARFRHWTASTHGKQHIAIDDGTDNSFEGHILIYMPRLPKGKEKNLNCASGRTLAEPPQHVFCPFVR